jgi:hypothetical protein
VWRWSLSTDESQVLWTGEGSFAIVVRGCGRLTKRRADVWGFTESVARLGPSRAHEMRAPVSRPHPPSPGRWPPSRPRNGGRRVRLVLRVRAPARGGRAGYRRSWSRGRVVRGDARRRRAELLAGQRRAPEGVVLLAGQQMPEQHRELARDSDDRDLAAPAHAHALIEGAHRTGGADRDERGLGEHLSHLRGTLLGDPAVARG